MEAVGCAQSVVRPPDVSLQACSGGAKLGLLLWHDAWVHAISHAIVVDDGSSADCKGHATQHRPYLARFLVRLAGARCGVRGNLA